MFTQSLQNFGEPDVVLNVKDQMWEDAKCKTERHSQSASKQGKVSGAQSEA